MNAPDLILRICYTQKITITYYVEIGGALVYIDDVLPFGSAVSAPWECVAIRGMTNTKLLTRHSSTGLHT